MIPYYKAKIKDADRFVEGFYFAYPETTYCFKEDYVNHPVEIVHCVCSHRMSDWGLPNRAICHIIDVDTLKQIGWFDQDRLAYGAEEWIYPMEVINENNS